MHILALEGWPTLLAGGQERSLFEVLAGLRERGVAVTLAYEQEGDLLPKYKLIGATTFRIRTRSLLLKSLKLPQNIWNFFVSVWCLLNQYKKNEQKWNLIYVNQYFDLPLAALYGMILTIPVACHLRLPAPHYLSRQYRWGLNRCCLLICNSHFTAKTYQQAGISAGKMVVIHNAIDTEEFSPTGEAESIKMAQRSIRQILYLGRIVKQKGIETLIDAMVLARKTDDRLRLLVVGNLRGDHSATIEYQQRLQNYARGKLGEAVEFRPATPNVVELYRLADLVVLPAEWDEPFGRVVIESMACGVPCLASRVGGIPEILNKSFPNLLFTRKDPNDLSVKIQRVIDWRSEYPKLGCMCREMVESEFSSKKMLDKLLEVLNSECSSTV